MIFYENGRGFAGTAVIQAISSTVVAEAAALCPGLPAHLFPYRVALDRVDIFDAPVDCRPLIDDLTFIANKQRWGLAFMGSHIYYYECFRP